MLETRSARGSAASAIGVLALAVLLLGPALGLTSTVAGPSRNPIAPVDAAHQLPASSSVHPQGVFVPANMTTRVGPIDGHFWGQSLVSRGDGVANGAIVLVDPGTQVIYALSYEPGLITAYAEATGNPLAWSSTDTFGYLDSAALDAVHHQLWVFYEGRQMSYSVPYGPSFVQALNESTLALEANVSLPGSLGLYSYHMVFDSVTQELFIFNGTGGRMVLNTTTHAVSTYIRSPVASCYTQDAIIAHFGGTDTVYVSCYYHSVFEINAQTDQLIGYVNGTYGAFLALAFDPVDNQLFVANWTSPSNIIAYHLGVRVGLIPTQIYIPGGALLYDNSSHTLLYANESPRYSIDQVSPTTFLRIGNLSVPYGVDQLASDTSTGLALTGGWQNDTSLAIRTSPLAIVHIYASLPGSLDTGPAFDAGTGAFYGFETESNALVAYNSTTGQRVWKTTAPPVPSISNMRGLFADVSTGILYGMVVNSYAISLDKFSAATGAYLGNISLGGNVYGESLAGDPVHNLLYVAYQSAATYISGLWVVSTASGAVLSNTTLPSWIYVCSMFANPRTTSVWIYNCNTPTNFTQFSSLNLSLYSTHPVDPSSSCEDSWAVNATGFAFATCNNFSGGTANVSVLDPGSPSRDQVVRLPAGFFGTSIAVDDGLGRVFVPLENYGDYPGPTLILSESDFTTLGRAPLPGVAWSVGLDPITHTLCLPIYNQNVLLFDHILFAPGMPAAVSARAGNGTLTISWHAVSASATAPVVGYNVSVATSPSGVWTTTSTTNLTATISGLTDGSKYYATVQAYSLGGNGPTTAPVNATPLGVPYPPVGVAATPVGSTGLHVTWQPAAETGGSPITNFTVQYEVSSGSWKAVTVGASVTSNDLMGLTPGTTYSIRVYAANAVGPGNPSGVVHATTGSSSNSLFSGASGLTIGILLVVVVIVAAVAALLLMRRRRGMSPSPPTNPASPPPGTSAAPIPPPPR